MPTKPFYIRQKPPAQSFIQLPSFLFEAPSFCALSNEAKIFVCDDPAPDRVIPESGWADDYGKIYLYYPINEVCGLLHCGRQKAVDTLRELQYADLVSIKNRGVENPTGYTQNATRRFHTPTSRNPVEARQRCGK